MTSTGWELRRLSRDFPADGPILIITDGACDVLRVRREHAFLVPAGARLPFTPRGPVFRVNAGQGDQDEHLVIRLQHVDRWLPASLPRSRLQDEKLLA